MDQPYQPPAAEPEEPQEEKAVANKVAKAARILAIGALVVGGLLLIPSRNIEDTLAALRGHIDGLGMPRWVSVAMGSCYKEVVGIGMALACFAMSTVSFKKERLALVLALLAILIIGGWTAMLLYVLTNLIRGMAR